ncbi:MAG: YgiQ family radical SAM protein [Bacteroidales bacterium]
MNIKSDSFIPTSKKEVEALGWDYIDVILFSGDAYVDHPSFGTAVIARVLEREGYRVAIVPQPNWRDDLRDFKKLGVPRLFFGVNAGVMDSMVNHYTANKRLRSNDAYTPDGRASQRPDYAVKVYSNILKELYPSVPVIIGGIEASLRRVTHYDYWQDRLMPSILVDSKADILVYGMGEKSIVEIARMIGSGASLEEVKTLPQIAYIADYEDNGLVDRILLHSFEECTQSKIAFAENFNQIERESNSYIARHLIEPYMDKYVHINSPYEAQTIEEIDSYWDLPFTKLPHPRYIGKHIPAYEMIKFSINTHRGCFGSCSFCTISAHQGKFVQSRSKESILKEIGKLTEMEEFKGNISDVGGPTANMYSMKGKDMTICKNCKKESCIYPKICFNLNHSHDELLDLYQKIGSVPKVKRAFVGSGIRYDLFLNGEGYLDESGKRYLREVIVKHTSGRFKVAPEHTEEHVLKAMGKPSFKSFTFLKEEFERIVNKEGLKYQLVPYFISSHPGCKLSDMKALSLNPGLKGIILEQVQDFTPTPLTRSSVAFYTHLDPKTLKDIFVETNPVNKQKQKQFFFNKK